MQMKFKNPPINELAIGVYFESEIEAFRTEHVGLFWSRIRNEYPKCRQQPVITPPVAPSGHSFVEYILSDEGAPMPRYMFESTDGVTLVQVQKNGFVFNWRKREAEYPHFDAVKEAFDRYYAIFADFIEEVIGQPKLSIRITDLTYINVIDGRSGWHGMKDTNSVLPRFSLPAMMDVPTEFNQMMRFSVAPDLGLNVAVRNGKTVKDQENVLLLELRALGVLGSVGKGQADEWFARAHDAIGSCFFEMTSPDIQERFWERT